MITRRMASKTELDGRNVRIDVLLCVLAEKEATDEDATLSSEFAGMLLNPGTGGEEQSAHELLSQLSKESQTTLGASCVQCSIDVGVQCSPDTVDKGTMVTGCSVVSSVTFICVVFLCLYRLHHHLVIYSMPTTIQCLQCFDTVGWVAGRASSL